MAVVVVAWAPVLEPSDWIRYAAASVVVLKLVVDVREMNENVRLRNRQVDGYDPNDCFMTRRAKTTTATMMMLLVVSYMYRGSWIYQVRQAELRHKTLQSMRGSDDASNASNGPKTFAYLPTENNVWSNPEYGATCTSRAPNATKPASRRGDNYLRMTKCGQLIIVVATTYFASEQKAKRSPRDRGK